MCCVMCLCYTPVLRHVLVHFHFAIGNVLAVEALQLGLRAVRARLEQGGHQAGHVHLRRRPRICVVQLRCDDVRLRNFNEKV